MRRCWQILAKLTAIRARVWALGSGCKRVSVRKRSPLEPMEDFLVSRIEKEEMSSLESFRDRSSRREVQDCRALTQAPDKRASAWLHSSIMAPK